MRGRRELIVFGGVILTAGCVGDRLEHRDDVPHPMDTDDKEDLRSVDLERIEDFARESNETILAAEEAFSTWVESPASADIDKIDQLRIAATELLDTYDAQVAPYRDDIDALEPGDIVDGYQWEANGSALMTVLRGHETMLFRIEEASIGVVDADGNPGAVSGDGLRAIESIQEEAEPLVAETDAALAGEEI